MDNVVWAAVTVGVFVAGSAVVSAHEAVGFSMMGAALVSATVFYLVALAR